MRRAMSFDSQTVSSSDTRSLSTTMRISRPAWSAKAFETPSNESAMLSSFSSRLTYDSRMSRRAPGRAAEMASAAWTIIASSDGQSMSMWCAATAMQHRLALAVLAQEIEAELEMRALQVAVDRLADVVQERRARGDVAVEAEFLGHDAGEERDFARVVQHVLSVAGAELQASHQSQHFGVEVVEPELERRRFAFLADGFLHLGLDLLDDLLDARRMDAAVGDEPRDGLARDLAAERIERRQDDRARRVVDDELDAGGLFERADVASFAADDPPLHVVARQIDNRHGRFDGVLGGAALDGVGDDVLGALGGGLARLGLQPLDQVGGVAPRVGFDLFQQELARLLGGQAGDALQLALPLGERSVRPRAAAASARFCRSASAVVARAQVALELSVAAMRSASARVLSASACSRPAISCWRSRACRSASATHGVRLLARFELGFLLEGLGLALGLLAHHAGLFFGASDGIGRDSLAAGDPPDDGADCQRDRRTRRDAPGRGTRRTGSSRDLYLLTARGRRVVEEKRPRFAVWGGRLNLG